MSTNRERESQTLNFAKPKERGSAMETFFPWDLTVQRFEDEGMPPNIIDGKTKNLDEKYFPVKWGEGIMDYEAYLGFDSVYRIGFVLPFRKFEAAAIATMEDWQLMKERADKELEDYFTDEAIEKAYLPIKEGHDRGDYSIRMNIEGFFWVPRELMGVEEHLYAFYDEPELMHDINQYVLDIYITKLMKVIKLVQPDVVYIMEDLSGKTGPMISPDSFEEFVGDYYRKIIPLMKAAGVGNVFVDTDGDFTRLIPNFIEAGVDGFLPMDVNAGMDIVAVREQFPQLKFIGGFNKLEIAKGPEAIDAEFARILPVIRGGGYAPGSDHQVAPSTSFEDYQYYIGKLKEMMSQAGADI